jgi:hypothetical protein
MSSPVHRQPLPALVVFAYHFSGNDSRLSHLIPVADKNIQAPGYMTMDKTDRLGDVKNDKAGRDLRRIGGETLPWLLMIVAIEPFSDRRNQATR